MRVNSCWKSNTPSLAHLDVALVDVTLPPRSGSDALAAGEGNARRDRFHVRKRIGPLLAEARLSRRALVSTQSSLAPFAPGFVGEKGWG